ncbi:hypothetical protein JCM21900_002272 [Sporobolomyces salmonicolor]
MGVKTLWPELEPGHSISSWAQLSEDAFKRSKGVRGLRIGVDLSLWLHHMKRMATLLDDEGNPVSAGANADLRMVFFRLCAFLQHGILAVFVFDGPHRPSWKRGKHVAGQWRGPGERELKQMFELLGMEWRRAEGEAEAELAEMNRRGEIDAVLSDDVDSFLFGAEMVIRNPSKTLSASQSKTAVARRATTDLHSSPIQGLASPSFSPSFPPSSQYDPVPASSDHALVTFSSSDILTSTGLGRAELILIALMSGGDYATEGMLGCGIVHSKGLAQAGYAKQLLDGIKELEGNPDAQKEFLAGWREEIADVLRMNRNKLFDKRAPALASKILAETNFPNLDVVRSYVRPRVSRPGSSDPLTWERRIDVPALVTFISHLFEWGHEELTAKFRNLVWIGLAMREMRRAALDADRGTLSPSSSSYPLLRHKFIQGITDLKTGPSTEFAPSYRIQLDPAPFDALVHAALPQPDPFPFPNYDRYDETYAAELRAERKRLGRAAEPPKKPDTGSFRHWVPRGFVEALGEGRERVRKWKEARERKVREKEEKEERKRARERAREEGRSSPVKKKASASQEAGGGGKGRKKNVECEHEGDESAGARQGLEEDKVKKLRAEILAKANTKGKGKAGTKAVSQGKDTLVQDDSDSLPSTSRLASTSRAAKASTSTAIRLSSLLSSADIEIATAPSTSRLRSTPRSPAANLLNSFTASKSTVPAASSSKPFTFSVSSNAFASAKLAVKPAPKRAIRPSSDSDDVLAASSDEDHADKSRRRSMAQTSPSKKRALRTASGGTVIDLSISSSSSESTDEDRIGSAEEDMDEWFERRRRNAEASKGASGQASSSRIAKAASSNGGMKKATQVLVLDDSD